MIPTLILTLTIRYHRYILTLKVLLGLVSILALNLYFSRHHFFYRTQYKNFKDFLFKLRGFQKSKDSTFLKILHTFLTFSTQEEDSPWNQHFLDSELRRVIEQAKYR